MNELESLVERIKLRAASKGKIGIVWAKSTRAQSAGHPPGHLWDLAIYKPDRETGLVGVGMGDVSVDLRLEQALRFIEAAHPQIADLIKFAKGECDQ